MKYLVFSLVFLLSFNSFSQDSLEEFIPIDIKGENAFISTKTGEYIFMSHETTDANELVTTDNGVIYTDKSIHSVKAGESLFSIAKKYKLSVSEVKKQNDLKNSKLSIGQKLNILKKFVIKSSSPVISQEPSTIIARLPPNETPSGLNPPVGAPSTTSAVIETTQEADIIEDVITEEIQEDTTTLKTDSYYIVKKGDSLYSIAKEHDLTVQELKDLNGLTLNNLSIGQKLKLQ